MWTSKVIRSYIGRAAIRIDPKIKIKYEMPPLDPTSDPKKFVKDPRPNYMVDITGPLGTVKVELLPFVRLSQNSNSEMLVSIENRTNTIEKSMWGTSRALLNNAINGCLIGHKCILTLKGIGYRAILEDRDGVNYVGVKAGFSHFKYFKVPSTVKADVFQSAIVLSGVNLQQVKLFAHTIRNCNKPEPYKGKGIFIDGETIKIKERKK